jgi:hypothetical protein
MILSRYRYRCVTIALPSRYHFRVIVTHGDTPSIIVTHGDTPSIIVTHGDTPSIIVTLPSLTVPGRPDRP